MAIPMSRPEACREAITVEGEYRVCQRASNEHGDGMHEVNFEISSGRVLCVKWNYWREISKVPPKSVPQLVEFEPDPDPFPDVT